MANTIQEQFNATGYAKVLVELTGIVDEAPDTTVGLAVGRAAAPRPDSAALSRYFVLPAFAQQAALGRPAKRRGRRSASDSVAALGVTAETGVPRVRVYPHLSLALGTVAPEGLEALVKDKRVRAVHAAPPVSLIRPVASVAGKRTPGVSWGINRLGVPELWTEGLTGKGVLVGHLDTGVDAKHPALQGAIFKFAEFDMRGDQVPGAKAYDSGEHGTHTAGTIAGRKVGTSRFGVAPGAKLASALVIEGGDVIARILAGMDWVASLEVRILSMSLGLRGYSQDFLPVTRALRARNILPVIACGNDYAGTSRAPGNYAEALSVGAIDSTDAVADFSSSDRIRRQDDPIVPDIVAPGVGVLSCLPGGKYAEMDGTSMATPHIAGLAALLMEAKPTRSALEIEQAIFKSSSLPSGASPDRANRGVPDGPVALSYL